MQKEKNKTDEIIANIAHQWRQPLSQINATVSLIDKLLYEKKIQDPEIEEKLQEIERLTKYMSKTIDDFKTNFDAIKEKVQLQEIIGEALEPLLGSFKDANISLISEIDNSYEIECYRDELKQIIIVLLNNAKDALLDRNTFNALVKISVSKVQSSYCIDISDNAGGISKSVMSKMFEPYYTTKHSSTGTGLGLFMARKIIQEKHNGSLEVKNVAQGSCFSITLEEKQT